MLQLLMLFNQMEPFRIFILSQNLVLFLQTLLLLDQQSPLHPLEFMYMIQTAM